MQGVKHLVQCHCVLPQFRGTNPTVFHKFVVFSVIDDQDAVTEKVVKCPNCDALHRVTEIGKSEIVPGKDGSSAAVDVEDIKCQLPTSLSAVLDRHKVDDSTYEQALFYVNTYNTTDPIVLARERLDDGSVTIKSLWMRPDRSFKIETAIRQEEF
jgi:hypothetical protein